MTRARQIVLTTIALVGAALVGFGVWIATAKPAPSILARAKLLFQLTNDFCDYVWLDNNRILVLSKSYRPVSVGSLQLYDVRTGTFQAIKTPPLAMSAKHPMTHLRTLLSPNNITMLWASPNEWFLFKLGSSEKTIVPLDVKLKDTLCWMESSHALARFYFEDWRFTHVATVSIPEFKTTNKTRVDPSVSFYGGIHDIPKIAPDTRSLQLPNPWTEPRPNIGLYRVDARNPFFPIPTSNAPWPSNWEHAMWLDTSSDGKRQAYVASIEEPMSIVRRLKGAATKKPTGGRVMQLNISSSDGTGMKVVGSADFEVRFSAPIHHVRWRPDSKALSFAYKQRLYLIENP